MPNRSKRTGAIAPVVTALALLLATPVPAAIRIGTDQGETITGTHAADQITGGGGDDTLKGLAGNDVYSFRGTYGSDTVVERASYKIGTRRVPGGVDTVSFAQDSTGVFIGLIRQWPCCNKGFAQGAQTDVEFGASVIENAVGSHGGDNLIGGGEANRLNPGGGPYDQLTDYGGVTDFDFNLPDLPASNDRYTGFAGNTGTDDITDYGGTADILDLRPFKAADVYLDAFDSDADPERESLLAVTGTNGTTPVGVVAVGHFGEHDDLTTAHGQQGRIEKLVFADGTQNADAAFAASTMATGGKRAELATAAKRMAAEARKRLADHSPAEPLPAHRDRERRHGDAHPTDEPHHADVAGHRDHASGRGEGDRNERDRPRNGGATHRR